MDLPLPLPLATAPLASCRGPAQCHLPRGPDPYPDFQYPWDPGGPPALLTPSAHGLRRKTRPIFTYLMGSDEDKDEDTTFEDGQYGGASSQQWLLMDRHSDAETKEEHDARPLATARPTGIAKSMDKDYLEARTALLWSLQSGNPVPIAPEKAAPWRGPSSKGGYLKPTAPHCESSAELWKPPEGEGLDE